MNKLLIDGELGAADSAMLSEYRVPEVRAELDIWSEELGFTLIEIRSKVYLVPDADSRLLSLTIGDIRQSESRGDRMIEAFLQCYVTMIILWKLYGGKNKNPKQSVFLQIKDIVLALDERLSNDAAQASSSPLYKLEAEHEINFAQISSYWSGLQVDDDQKRKTRVGSVMRACRFMERQKLLLILDGNREIRPTERLDDLMIGHYLNMNRIEEIHKLFDSAGEDVDAKAEQD